jgi:hypothetical protein
MLPIFHRLGFLKLSRGAAVVLLVIGATVAAAFWIGPFRPLPASLHLYVSNATASGPNRIFVAAKQTSGSQRARYPLVLAAMNNGARAAAPTTLDLSIPSGYRLLQGLHPLAPDISAGNPLAHYSIDISGIALPADSTVYSITSDTLWIEPKLGDYDCAIMGDSVPDFVPPTLHSATAIARVPVFYSFEGMPERQTGMFTAELDSTLLKVTPTPMPPKFPSYEREPEAPRPDLGTIREAGVRTAYCGDPQDPIELYTANWETGAGGRFLVVYVNGAPRKQLFDLDRDSIVELEMWDPNGDGRFEAWRQAHFAIPTIVLPERLVTETASNDSLMNDPRWLTTFDDTTSGPFRFLSDSARARRIPPVADTVVTRVDTTSAGTPRVVVDSTWLRKFYETSAGPYRFLKNPPARRAGPPKPDSTVRARPRRRPPSDVPLGRPVPMPPMNTGGG